MFCKINFVLFIFFYYTGDFFNESLLCAIYLIFYVDIVLMQNIFQPHPFATTVGTLTGI